MSDFIRRALGRHAILSIEDEAGAFVPLHTIDWSWPTGTGKTVIPPMVRAVEPAPEPESASVTLLRSLVADRRRVKASAESARDSRIKQAEEAERRATDLRERAKDNEATVAQADEEIATILADIEKLGGKAEA